MSIKENYEGAKKAISDEIKETKTEFSDALDKGRKKASSFFKKLMWALIALTTIAFIGFMIYANLTYSNGSRAGQLIKISKKGVILKTYEGQLSLGGISSSAEEGANFGNIWEFSVATDEVYQQMEALRGKQVVLTYKEKYVSLPWRGDTKYMVTAVKSN